MHQDLKNEASNSEVLAVAAALEDGSNADIFYDASSFDDVAASNRIETTKQAMRKAAALLKQPTTTGELSEAQKSAIRCAHADLAGVYQCAIRDGNGGADNGHDWKAHRETVEELEAAFPDILDHIHLDDGEDEEEDADDREPGWYVISSYDGATLSGPYGTEAQAQEVIDSDQEQAGGVTHLVEGE